MKLDSLQLLFKAGLMASAWSFHSLVAHDSPQMVTFCMDVNSVSYSKCIIMHAETGMMLHRKLTMF